MAKRSGNKASENPRLVEEVLNATPPYRELFERGRGLVCTHSLDGILLSVNPAAAHLLGYEPSELVGKNLAHGILASTRNLFRDYLRRMQEHGADQGFLRVCTRDGGERLLFYNNVLSRPDD